MASAMVQPIMAHVEDLFRSALALLGNRRQAEEAVVETCRRAHDCLAESSVLPVGRSWIFGLLLDEVRRRRGRLFTVRMVGAGAGDETLNALRKLPGDGAEAILLVEMQGFSYRETADALGVSRETLIDRLACARRELRATMGAAYPEPARASSAACRVA